MTCIQATWAALLSQVSWGLVMLHFLSPEQKQFTALLEPDLPTLLLPPLTPSTTISHFLHLLFLCEGTLEILC